MRFQHILFVATWELKYCSEIPGDLTGSYYTACDAGVYLSLLYTYKLIESQDLREPSKDDILIQMIAISGRSANCS